MSRHVSSDAAASAGSIKLKTNDFPIDLKQATIYKYTIQFLPKDITSKEKKVLAEKFLTGLKLKQKNRTMIHNDNFDLYLPNDDPEMEKAFLQVVCVRQAEYFDGAILTYRNGKRLYTKVLNDQLITRPSGQRPFPTESSTNDYSLQLYTVETTKEKIEVGSIGTNPQQVQSDPAFILQQKAVLRALDGILHQQARDTCSVQVHGKKVFDVAGEAVMEGPTIELRRGLNAETCLVNGSAFRRITPCVRFFLKSMKLSELVRIFSSTEPDTGPSLDMEQISHVLKGVKVKKMYGKQAVVELVGFAAGNADQETFYWNSNKTTTISHYLEKVYHVENPNEYPEQKCVIAESFKRKEALPPSLCFVLPGQLFKLPASSDYFHGPDKRELLRALREVPNSCVSETDGGFTKLLKCSVSPSIGAKFGLKVSGIEERSVLEDQTSRNFYRTVEGRVLEKPIATVEKNPKLSRAIILLGFGSDFKNLKSALGTAFGKHASAVASQVMALYQPREQCDRIIQRMVTDAREQLIKDSSPKKGQIGQTTSAHLKPAIVGIFRRPQDVGGSQSVSQRELEMERLQSTYGAAKLFCHKEGYHFAGTFVPHGFKLQDGPKMRTVVSNCLRRLVTQVDSANDPVTPDIVPVDRPHKTFVVAIHVSALQAQSPGPSAANAQHTPIWYAISLVAKWSGFDGFHSVRTFLQKSGSGGEKRARTFPGVLIPSGEGGHALRELIGASPLAGSSLIVFRTGVRAGTGCSDGDRKAEFTRARRLAAAVPALKQAAASGKPIRGSRNGDYSPGKSAGWHQAAATGTLVENPISPKTKNVKVTPLSQSTSSIIPGSAADEGSSVGRSDEISKYGTTEGTSPERRSERGEKASDTTSNSEVAAFLAFAEDQNARLVYAELNSQTRARLFGPGLDSVVESGPLAGKQKKATISVATSFLPSNKEDILQAAPKPLTTDLLIQKKLPQKAGPNSPVHVRIHSLDEEHPTIDQSLLDALSESSWDFPAGVWSSKDLSCVTLAKKANKHAMRVVEFNHGEPSLPEVHADLRDGLYFI